MDPHRILGTTPESTPEEIVAAYRRRARKHHPDIGGDDWAFILVERAYQYLLAGQVGRWHEEMAWTGAGPTETATEPPKHDSSSTAHETAGSDSEPSASSTGGEHADESFRADSRSPSQEAPLGFREILSLLVRHIVSQLQRLTPRKKVFQPLLDRLVWPSWMTNVMRYLSAIFIVLSLTIIVRGVTGYELPFQSSWWQSFAFWSFAAWITGNYRRKLSDATIFKGTAIGLICAAAVLFSIRRERDRLRATPSQSPKQTPTEMDRAGANGRP